MALVLELSSMYLDPQVHGEIASRSYCLLLSEQEELNSWILRLGKVGLVVSATGVRHPQPSLYEQREQLSGI